MANASKRLLAALLALTLFCALLPVSSAASAISVVVDGRFATFNDNLGEPFIDGNNRTMVPLRSVSEVMSGVTADWDSSCRTAVFQKDVPTTIGGQYYILRVQVAFPIGLNQAWTTVQTYNETNGQTRDVYYHFTQTDTQAIIRDNRTYAPIRYLGEALLYTVSWDGANRAVRLAPASGDWGVAYLNAMRDKNGRFVGGDWDAKQYASYYARRSYNDKKPALTLLETTGALSSGTKTWLFQYTIWDGRGTEYLKITQSGQISFSSNRSTGFQRWTTKSIV